MTTQHRPLSRRPVLKGAAKLAAACAALLAPMPRPAMAQAQTIRIGFMAAVANGVEIGGQTYQIELVVKDNQSTPARSARGGHRVAAAR